MWKHWSLSALPMIPQRFGIKLINDEGIKKQFATIEKLMQAADSIINCGDAGQEGELIQRWVMQKAQAKCPVKRLWISSMTDEAIKQGFQELKDQGGISVALSCRTFTCHRRLDSRHERHPTLHIEIRSEPTGAQHRPGADPYPCPDLQPVFHRREPHRHVQFRTSAG